VPDVLVDDVDDDLSELPDLFGGLINLGDP
jgi:hypothetical protein